MSNRSVRLSLTLVLSWFAVSLAQGAPVPLYELESHLPSADDHAHPHPSAAGADSYPLRKPDGPGLTKDQVAKIVSDIIASMGSRYPEGLRVKLLNTEQWADYVNHHHFVPLTCEGLKEGQHFDFNWVPGETPEERKKKHHLPSAEVIETGEFLFWWGRCAYFDETEETCSKLLTSYIDHEVGHFRQWERLVANGTFESKWSSCGEYQCREVEVYLAEINGAGMRKDILLSRLPTLSEYGAGCRKSESAALSMKAQLDEMDALVARMANEAKAEGYATKEASAP
jgi:hypothetical protein